jgi:hypothetical protein
LTTGASTKVRVATVVDTDNVGSVDIFSLPITQLGKGANSVPLAINNADGLTSDVFCRFSTAAEAGGALNPNPHIGGSNSNAAASVSSDCKFNWDTSAGLSNGETHAVQLTAYTDATHYTQATFEVTLLDVAKQFPKW